MDGWHVGYGPPLPQYRNLSDNIEAANLDRRLLFLTEQIDECVAPSLLIDMMYLAGRSKEPIRIIMSSPGGDVYRGLLVYNAIRDVQRDGTPVVVEVFGLCASMATVILQAASKRIAHRGSRFLIHEVSEFKIFSEETATEKLDEAEELARINKTLVEILAERSTKNTEEIANLIKRRNYWLSANEAMSLGLVDEVV